MAGFKFVNSESVTFPIVDKNDELIKEYSFNFGSVEFMRQAQRAVKTLEQNNELLMAGDVDTMITTAKGVVDGLLGVGEFDFLFDKFQKNIIAIIELIKAITQVVDEKKAARDNLYK